MILYNKDKKAYVNYVEQTLRSDIVTDISLASELTEAHAKALLRKCTSKLKGFKVVNRSQLQPQITSAAASVIINAAESAQGTGANPELNSGQELSGETDQDESEHQEPSVLIKTPRRNFTTRERRDIYIRDNGTCGICGRIVPPNDFTIDHVIPISKGGTYDYDNLQCCCRKCNRLKDDALPDDFFNVILGIIDFQVSDKYNKKMKKGLKKLYKKACFSKKKQKKKEKKKKKNHH